MASLALIGSPALPFSIERLALVNSQVPFRGLGLTFETKKDPPERAFFLVAAEHVEHVRRTSRVGPSPTRA
jgi:hypothetical protein